MRKKALFILLLVFSIFFININVDAATKCDKKDELKAEASAIEVNYELIKSEKGENGDYDPTLYFYDIIITNISNNFEIGIGDSRYTYKDSKNGVLTIRMVGGGYKIRVGIYASSKTGCADTKLRTIPVELPIYNRYSDFEECIGHTNEYPICAPNANLSKYELNDDGFEKELKKQAEEYENKKNKLKEDNNDNKKKNILDLYMDNARITIPITIIVAIIILGYLLKWIFVDRKKTKINLGVKK